MNFKREKIRDMYLENTSVANIFLTEYLPMADGTSIKVYLTALMYADRGEMTNAMIARHLGIQEEEVLQAWNYWESCGVIRKHFPVPGDRFRYEVEFLDLRARLYSHTANAEKAEQEAPLRPEMDDGMLKELYGKIQELTGRMIASQEARDIIDWIYQDGLSPKFIEFVYKFCVDERHNGNYKYVAALINNWHNEGIDNEADAMAHLQATDQKHSRRRRVMQAMGFRRFPTEAEAERIDSWFDEMGHTMERVLEACRKTSGISSPSINYVDAILKNWSNGANDMAKPSQAASEPKNAVQLVKQQYEQLRKDHKAQREQRITEVYAKIPRMKSLEDEIRSTNVSMTRAALGGSGSDLAVLRKYIKDLQDTKIQLLNSAGFADDYMEMQYDCSICQDTGTTKNGERCSCFAEKLKQYMQ